jgi:Phosphotransferase enzyme family
VRTAKAIAKPIVRRFASEGLSRLSLRRAYACFAMGDEATGTPDGIDGDRVEAWFAENVPGAEPPLSFERIAGGHSNLTYRATDTRGHHWALRRPPLGKRLGSAHDMSREHRVVSALAATPVPVAPVVGLCADESVNDAPFYVMEFVEGPILRGLAEAEAFPDHDDRRAIGERVVDTLVDIHAVDPDAAGLGCIVGMASGRSPRPASCRSSTRSTGGSRPRSRSRARRRSSTATTASTT